MIRPEHSAYRDALLALTRQFFSSACAPLLSNPFGSGHCVTWACSAVTAARHLGAAPHEVILCAGGARYRTWPDRLLGPTGNSHFSYVADHSIQTMDPLFQIWEKYHRLPEMHAWVLFVPEAGSKAWLFDPTAHLQEEQAKRMQPVMEWHPECRISAPLWFASDEKETETSPAAYQFDLLHTFFAHYVAGKLSTDGLIAHSNQHTAKLHACIGESARNLRRCLSAAKQLQPPH